MTSIKSWAWLTEEQYRYLSSKDGKSVEELQAVEDLKVVVSLK